MQFVTSIFALLLTGMFYSLFPLLYSAFRKNGITKKKYCIFVLVETLSVLILFYVIYLAIGSESTPKVSAAIIWGNVSYYLGLIILKRNKKLLEIEAQQTPTTNQFVMEHPQVLTDEINYCHKCGNRIPHGSFFCNKCGEKIE